MIENLVMIASGKGGVGKSLLSSTIAAHAASGGWPTLVVDLDRSGDMAVNLGYGPRSDGGLNLADTFVSGAALRPLADVRENLDVVCGGPHIDSVTEALTATERSGGNPAQLLEEILAPLAETKSLVMVDLPPTAGVLHRAAFGVASYIAVPTTVDRCSVNGLAAVFEQLFAARANGNEAIDLLGVILNGVDSRATTITAEVTARLAELLGDTVAVLGPPIRWASKAVYDMREAGVTADEYLADAQAESKRRLGRLRRRNRGETVSAAGTQRYAANADSFAGDLAAVSDAVLAAYTEALAGARDDNPATDATTSTDTIDLRGGVQV